MTALSGTQIVWRGLTIYGTRASRHWLSTLEGWEDLPPTRRDTAQRNGHGTFGGTPLSDERTVIVAGATSTPDDRDALLAELQAVMWLPDSNVTSPLTITHAGRTLTANAQLTRFKPTMDTGWSAGRFGWAAEWVCPDPLRYAAPVVVAKGFAQLLGGLEFDLFTDGTDVTGLLEYGDPGTETGMVDVTNTGTAPAWLVFTVTGPTPAEGFDILVAGDRLRFSAALSTGQTLVIDTADGTVLLDGVDRRVLLTIREWRAVAKGETATVVFTPLGGPTSGQLSVSLAPAFW